MYLDLLNQLGDASMAEQLRQAREAGREVPGILYLLANRPEWTTHLMQFTSAVMRGRGGLPIWQRELIAALTSRCNQCAFCCDSHAAAATVLLQDAGQPDPAVLVAAVLADVATAPLSTPDRLLYAQVERWAIRRSELTAATFDDLRDAGWEQAQLFEASTIVALFCFFNAWVSGHGINALSPAANAASGLRLARGNYRPG